MKKFSFILALIALCLASALLLTACTMGIKRPKKNAHDDQTTNNEIAEGSDDDAQDADGPDEEVLRTEDWSFTANTPEEAKEIFDDFFYLTIYDDHLIVTVANEDGVFLTETIDGDKEHIEYTDGIEAFAYKDGDQYLYAVKDGNNRYYLTDEDSYYDNILCFLFYLSVFEDLPENAEISLMSRGTSSYTEYNVFIDATLSLSIHFDTVTMIFSAEKEHDWVKNFKSVFMDENGMSSTELKFTAKNVSVEMPDLTDWFNASAPLVASDWYVTGKVGGKDCDEVPMYFDYISGSYQTDYVDIMVGDSFTVKNKKDATVSYSQKVDEEFLAGHEKIVFEPDNENICFEIDADPDEDSID